MEAKVAKLCCLCSKTRYSAVVNWQRSIGFNKALLVVPAEELTMSIIKVFMEVTGKEILYNFLFKNSGFQFV